MESAADPAIEVVVIWPTEADPVASDFNVSLPVNVVYKTLPEPTFRMAPGERFILPVPVIVGFADVPVAFTVNALLTVSVTPVMVKVGTVPLEFGPIVSVLTVTDEALKVGCLLDVNATTPICTRSVATGTVPKLQLPVFAHFTAFDPPAAPVQLFMAPTAIVICAVPDPLALVAVIV